jgi:hypothetical protein
MAVVGRVWLIVFKRMGKEFYDIFMTLKKRALKGQEERGQRKKA